MVKNLSEYRLNHSFLFWLIFLTLNLLVFFNLDASGANLTITPIQSGKEQQITAPFTI